MRRKAEDRVFVSAWQSSITISIIDCKSTDLFGSTSGQRDKASGPAKGRVKPSYRERSGGLLLAAGLERCAWRNAGEIILFAKAAIDAACYAGCQRSFDKRRAATNQYGESDLCMRLVCLGNLPGDRLLIVRAR